MKYKILLVEQESAAAEKMIRTLEDLGHFVFFTSFYSEATHALESNRFDILIIDPVISNQDGVEVITHARDVHEHIVTFVLATPDNCANVLTTVQPMIYGYLYKPYNPDKMIQNISRVMSKKRRRQKYNILAIGAYPGDVEIGCGGTLAMHAYKGDNITIAILDMCKDPEGLEQMRASAKLLGAQLVVGNEHDYPGVSYSQYVMRFVEDIIHQSKPGIIYTHGDAEGLRKRKNIHMATMLAAQQAPIIYGYFSQSTTIEFQPSRFSDISSHVKDKQKLLDAYKSMKTVPHFSRSMTEATARYWGHFVGFTLVEPFELVRS